MGASVSEKFDWDDGCLIVPFYPAQNKTAVYTNPFGDIVLRQHNPHSWKDDEDNVLIFRPEHAEAIVRAIIQEVGLPYVLVPQVAENACSPDTMLKDRTAAERQRRRRNKLRQGRDANRDDGVAVTGVTPDPPLVLPDRANLVLLRAPDEQGEEEVQETALTR
ncbi:hypothetical protein ACVWWI_004010 [Bradyrhizobium sp. USDA 3686]